MCLRGICRCPQRRGSLCISFMQPIRVAHREIVLGYNEAVGAVADGAMETQLPVNVEDQGKTSITLGRWAPPCTAIGMLCHRMWCKGGLCVRMP